MIFLIVHFGKEWKLGIQTRHAHIYGIIWGWRECKQTWWKAKWNVPVRLKQFKIEKRKVELKEKKLEKMRLKEDVPGAACAIGVQLQISILKQTYIFSHDTSCLWSSIKFQTRGVPQAIFAQRHTTTCMSHHIKFKVAAWLVPPNDPINACALSLGPRLSLFSEVNYYL